METVETLEAAALHLPPGERARLVERLLATLDAVPEVEEAWVAEVERRQAEIERRAVSLLPQSQRSILAMSFPDLLGDDGPPTKRQMK